MHGIGFAAIPLCGIHARATLLDMPLFKLAGKLIDRPQPFDQWPRDLSCLATPSDLPAWMSMPG